MTQTILQPKHGVGGAVWCGSCEFMLRWSHNKGLKCTVTEN